MAYDPNFPANELLIPDIPAAIRVKGESIVEMTAPKSDPVFSGLVTTAGQIKFPATQNPSSDPNTLDDYEEGTWTPSVVGGNVAGICTYTTRNGKYVKVGGRVFFDLSVNWSDHTGNGPLGLTGLPFYQGAGIPYGVCSILVSGVSFNGELSCYISGMSIYPMMTTSGAAVTNLGFSSAGVFFISGSYFV